MNDISIEYSRWLARVPGESPLHEELVAIKDNERELTERFYTELEFGTAGLRGILGAGTNRMNIFVVRRAAAGLARYILRNEGKARRGVAIAFDSRELSPELAMETARTIAAYGVRALLFPSLRPVPMLSFAVRELKCAAGVVITASHNPPEYNGFKVYWEDGGQVGPGEAAAIYKEMLAVDYFDIPVMDETEAREKGLMADIGPETDEAYYKATASLLQWPEMLRRHGGDMRLVYTPLHGSGAIPVMTLLSRVGVTDVSVVPEQEKPDSRFPTVKAPNPEDPAAFTLAIELAKRQGACAIIATDPDSDRMGLALRRADGEYQTLSGNRIGCLLLHYILTSMRKKGTLPRDGFAVKSLVSTRMADAICARFNIECMDVPTGFRFISEKIEESVNTGRGTFIFGFEESYGFLAGGFSRDKDAVCAAMLTAEACVYYAQEGKTLFDVLGEMEGIYGCFDETVKSYTLKGKEGLERIARAMAALRRAQPTSFGDAAVERAQDMLPGGVNVLRYFLRGGAWICVRPSGTEPKLKLYIGANAPDRAALDALLSGLMHAADGLITKLLA